MWIKAKGARLLHIKIGQLDTLLNDMRSTFLVVLGTALLASAQTSAPWGQCGGIGYTGPTVCSEGFTCLYFTPCERSPCRLAKLTDLR